jgi:hypothetical protein
MTSNCSYCSEISSTFLFTGNCLFSTNFSFSVDIPDIKLNIISIYVIYNEFFYQLANTTSLRGSHFEIYTYTLEGLKYANTLYDVRVYLSSALAVREDKWSAPTINTFRTKPTSEYTDGLSVVDSAIHMLPFIISCFYRLCYEHLMHKLHGCCYNVK